METQRVVDFPNRSMDKRPRKRPRLAWDLTPAIPPAPPKILPTIYCAPDFGAIPSYACSSVYYKGIPRNGSPPWRPDDKDGHYVFAIGENITPRYRMLSKVGEESDHAARGSLGWRSDRSPAKASTVRPCRTTQGKRSFSSPLLHKGP